MNIFCCVKPLWLGESWLCTHKRGHISHIEAEINQEIAVYLDYQPAKIIALFRRVLADEISGRLWTSSTGETILLIKNDLLQALLDHLSPYQRSFKALYTDLKIVFSNIEHKRLSKPQALLEVPEDLPIFKRFGNMIETMSHYPLSQSPIALQCHQFVAFQEMASYVLALQSKGYLVVLHVHDDEEYRIAEQTGSDYILYG